jgi:diadenosine tetraphosphatase ApaH/serine/threonine PP2A family protein phosphatase
VRDDCTLVHGSPYGPLWEYLTSEVLAERSFQHFSTRFCIVGHTHVPVIFQQPDVIANSPTAPLELDVNDDTEEEALQRVVEQVTNEETPEDFPITEGEDVEDDAIEKPEQTTENDVEEQIQADNDDMLETHKMPIMQYAARIAAQSDRVHTEGGSLEEVVAEAVDVIAEVQYQMADDISDPEITATTDAEEVSYNDELMEDELTEDEPLEQDVESISEETTADQEAIVETEAVPVQTPEATIQDAEERLNAEIEELLSLLGLSQSMINITNEMLIPPEGSWQTPKGYRAIINPGGVGQPRDGDPRAAFMIYDTERGFTFYRIPYPFEKTQEKIRHAKLPHHLATRLAYGR